MRACAHIAAERACFVCVFVDDAVVVAVAVLLPSFLFGISCIYAPFGVNAEVVCMCRQFFGFCAHMFSIFDSSMGVKSMELSEMENKMYLFPTSLQ